METYSLNVNNKIKEANTITQVLYNNKYDPSLLNNLTPLTNNTKTELNKTKWAKFTHVSKETKFITKLFKHTTLNVAFKTQNTIGKCLSQQHNHQQEKYENSGIYQLSCPICNKKYIGQIGRLFHIRFWEHYCDYKYRNNKSKFVHLLENKHYWPHGKHYEHNTLRIKGKC